MVTRIDLEEKVKAKLRSNESLLWCGSTVAGAKMWEMEESGIMVIIGSVIVLILGILSILAVFTLDCTASDKVMLVMLALCCIGGVVATWRLKSAGANYALTDKCALLLTDSGRTLKEYNFSDKNLIIDYRASKRNVGYVELVTIGYRGRREVHFRFKGVYEPLEVYNLAKMVLDYINHGGVKIVQTGKPADKEAPVTAAQPVTEKPLALSGYKKLSDVIGVQRHISDAEDTIKPLNIQYEAEEYIYEHLEPGEKLLWCEKQDKKSGRSDKGGCLFSTVVLVVVFELVVQLFGWYGNYPEEIYRLTRKFFIPVYIFMGIMVLAMLFKRYNDVWAITDRRLMRVSGKKHVVCTLLSDVPMNGIQIIERPKSNNGDLRIRAGWKDLRTNKPLNTIEIWQGVTNVWEVADLIDRASVRYLKMQGFEEVGIESEQLFKDNAN